MSNVHKLDPYARAKRMHPSSQPAPGNDEHDGRGALVLAFPVRSVAASAAAAMAVAEGHPAVARR